jgi:hypothetical protein
MPDNCHGKVCDGAVVLSSLASRTIATHFGVRLITASRHERGHQRHDTLANNYRQWLTAD